MASPHLVRLPWIDHLRTLVIVLVVHLHACVTYSHVGDWYAMSDHEPTLAAKVPFIVWEGLLQSFFMGLLFFISGYFAQRSLERRGTASFLKERLLRLGLPALFYMLVIHPFILLVLNPWNADFGPPGSFYLNYLRSGRFLGSTGPLWFVVALLIFCSALAAWRALRFGTPAGPGAHQAGAGSTPVAMIVPSAGFLGWFALALGLGSFAVRLLQPIGTSVLSLQLCFFVQYVAFFMAGVHAARRGWLLALAAASRARAAGWLALLAGPPVLLAIMFVGIQSGKVEDFFGGWHWQALAYAVWEQFSGVGLSLGLLALASRHFNVERPGLRWLADRSFGVYVLHAPILVGLAMWFRGVPANLYALVALLTVAGLLASYVAADLFRRVPVVREVL